MNVTMAKSSCVVLLLLIINVDNYCVIGQSTISDRNNDEQDFPEYYSDTLFALTNSIQTEFPTLKTQISRLENRVEEIKGEMQTENTYTKSEIGHLENCLDSQNTYMRNSFEEIKIHIDMEDMEMNEFQGLCQKLPRRHCPEGFNYSVAEFPKCYAILNDRVDWNTAQIMCSELNDNAQLAVINSSREQEIITDMIRYKNCSQQNEQHWGNEFWIGARRGNISDCNSTFVWASNTGTTFRIQYSNWAPDEPNCAQQREACAAIKKHYVSKWNDLKCTWYACPLCEVTINA